MSATNAMNNITESSLSLSVSMRHPLNKTKYTTWTVKKQKETPCYKISLFFYKLLKEVVHAKHKKAEVKRQKIRKVQSNIKSQEKSVITMPKLGHHAKILITTSHKY